MAHDLRTLQSLGLALLIGGAIAANTGCSSESSSDTGVGDSGIHEDALVTPPDMGVDAGPREVGPRDAQPPPDAAHFCTVNEQVDVSGTNVSVGESSMIGMTPNGRPDTNCSQPTAGTFNDPIFLRGCVNVLGTAPTMAELADLEFAVFPARDMDMMPVDPSFDPMTGADRQPNARLELNVDFDTSVSPAVCASQVQVDLGFAAAAAGSAQSEIEYIVRVRTATAAGTQTWATQYFFHLIGRNDNITKIGVGDCTSQTCFYRYNFTVMRAATLSSFAMQGAPAVPGAMNLRDGRGTGYGLVQVYDCGGRPMRYGVAGFAPAPLKDGYITGATLDLDAVEASADGLYLALGFPGQDMNATVSLATIGAVAVDRDGTCTEEFAGTSVRIYPDAVSVYRASRETVLHER